MSDPPGSSPVGRPDVARSRTWGTLAVVLVAMGWLVTSHPVPVYDGVGLPDEPYRYVHAPAGAKHTAAPTSAVGRSGVSNGTNSDFLNVFTGESGPQATANVPDGGVAATAGPVTVRITPLAPAEDPAGGTAIDGNVYQLDITSGAGPAVLTPAASQGALYLRAPRAAATEVMIFRPTTGQPWRGLTTARTGNDVWSAIPPGPGLFALSAKAPVVIDPAAPGRRNTVPAAARAGRYPAWTVVLLGVLLALAILILAIRRRATRTEQ